MVLNTPNNHESMFPKSLSREFPATGTYSRNIAGVKRMERTRVENDRVLTLLVVTEEILMRIERSG